jgi:hypothetical protein
MRFFKNNSINALFIIFLIVVVISTFNALFRAAINGERPPPQLIHVIGHNILDIYFEK